MQVRGWLLDVRLRDDEATLWVKTSEKRVELRCRYHPDLFFVPDKVSFNEFMDLFDEHPHIPVIETTTRYTSIENTEKSPVLRVSVDSPVHYRSVVRLVEKYGTAFDTDLSHTQRFLADHGLIPLAEVIVEVDDRGLVLSIEGVPLDLRVEPPPFKTLCYELHLEDEALSITTMDEEMQEEYSFAGSQGETLNAFLEYIEETDPRSRLLHGERYEETPQPVHQTP